MYGDIVLINMFCTGARTCAASEDLSSSPKYFPLLKDDVVDNSWVDDYSKELGKRNLTFLIPEEKSEEDKSRVKPYMDACMDTLGCCDKNTSPNTTVSSIIQVTVAYYLYDILQQKAIQTCVYCAYTDEWCRKQPHTCIDTLPFFYIKGHKREITQKLFNKNFTDAQKYVLRGLGVVPSCECSIRDIAAGALQIWLRNPFLIASLKRVTRVEDSVSTVVKESLDIWKEEKTLKQHNGECV